MVDLSDGLNRMGDPRVPAAVREPGSASWACSGAPKTGDVSRIRLPVRREAGRVTPLGQPVPDRGPTAKPAPSSEGRHDDAARLGEGAEPDVWEVFRQEKDGDQMRHAGNVRAPDRDLATHYARELYSRRQESVRLWIVSRADITDLSDPDLLQPPLDRTFKKPGGYVMRDKLDAARKRAAASDGSKAGGGEGGAA